MAGIEHRVVTEIIRSGDFFAAERLGLTDALFSDPEMRQIFRLIRDHYFETRRDGKGKTPTLEGVRQVYSSFQLAELDRTEIENLPGLMTELKLLSLRNDLQGMYSYMGDLIESQGDPEEIIQHVGNAFEEIRRMHTPKRAGFGVHEVGDFLRDHWQRAKAGGLRGIPWPWDVLTKDTMGKGESDLIVFYGRMKSMKTWVLLYCAVRDFLAGYRVVFWSREMDEAKLKLRIGSIIGKVDYQLLKNATLPPPLYRDALKSIDQVSAWVDTNIDVDAAGVRGKTKSNVAGSMLILCGPAAPKSIEELRSISVAYGADIDYVDSFYHLTTSRAEGAKQQWQFITYLTEDLKQFALDEKIPVVAAAQANRLGEKLLGENMSEVAGSDAIAREADLIIRILRRRSSQSDNEAEDALDDADDSKTAEPAAQGTQALLPLPRPRVIDRLHKWNQTHKQTEEELQRLHFKTRKAAVGAELALILAGNREGVLEGFTIHCVPGHTFSIISSNFTAAQAKDWIAHDDAETKREILKNADDKSRVSTRAAKKEQQQVDLSRNAFQAK